jgi:hypothetical protein
MVNNALSSTYCSSCQLCEIVDDWSEVQDMHTPPIQCTPPPHTRTYDPPAKLHVVMLCYWHAHLFLLSAHESTFSYTTMQICKHGGLNWWLKRLRDALYASHTWATWLEYVQVSASLSGSSLADAPCSKSRASIIAFLCLPVSNSALFSSMLRLLSSDSCSRNRHCSGKA